MLLRRAAVAIACCTLLWACGKRVDPDALTAQLGTRANRFYRAVNDLKLDEAVPFVSPGLRERTHGPKDVPFLKSRFNLEFVQVLPQGSDVDWRRGVATVRVTRYLPYTENMPDQARTLRAMGTEVHRWVLVDGEWYFDGAADAAP